MSPENQPSRQMRDVTPSSLTHLPARISYLKSFQDFTVADGALIRSIAPILKPLVPAILDAVYAKLLSYSITAKAFVPRQPGHNGAVPADVQELTLKHPQIAHRRDFLRAYLLKLVGNEDWSDDSKYWVYLDKVGVMHTGEPGFDHRKARPELRVEYVHMGMLLGYVEDQVVNAVLKVETVDWEKRVEIVRAFNKLLWIQNDLFARHYVVDRDSGYAPKAAAAEHGTLPHRRLAIVIILATLFGVMLSRMFGMSKTLRSTINADGEN